MSFLELAKKRCSCRNFNDQQVPEETLQYILEAGRVAPTGVNKQPQHILVVRSKEGLAKMEQVTKFYNAQTVLIICTEPDAAWTRKGDDFSSNRKRRCFSLDLSFLAGNCTERIPHSG